jgi:hypothetical protein
MWKALLCRVGRHHWERRRNPDGGAYATCSRCGKDQYRGDNAMRGVGGEFTAGG